MSVDERAPNDSTGHSLHIGNDWVVEEHCFESEFEPCLWILGSSLGSTGTVPRLRRVEQTYDFHKLTNDQRPLASMVAHNPSLSRSYYRTKGLKYSSSILVS